MSFTYVTTTDAGRVRLLIDDVDSGNYEFEDAEIEAFLAITQTQSSTNNIFRAAAAALRSLASKYSAQGDAIKTLTLSIDRKQRAAAFTAAADKLEEMDANRPYALTSEVAITDFEAARIIINKDLREG